MTDVLKKFAIPTLGVVLIASWILGVDPMIQKTILGFFAAIIGFPMIGAGLNALRTGKF